MQNLDALEKAFASSLDTIKEMKMSDRQDKCRINVGKEEEVEEKENSRMDEMMSAFEEMFKKMQKMIEEMKPRSMPYVS